MNHAPMTFALHSPDQTGIKRLLAVVLVIGFFSVGAQTLPPVNFNTALREISDVSGLPAFRENTYCAQVSSYDTTGGNDDGFSGKYSYLRRNVDSTLVLFDQRGPGVIDRIWTPTPSDDSLAFYIDDLSKPAFIICYRDLFSGKIYPFTHPLCNNQLGGFYCYLPIPFQEHCRIVFKGKKTQFHQIQYRLYPAATKVRSFKLPLTAEEQAAVKAIQIIAEDFSLSHTYGVKTFLSDSRTIQLEPGQTQSIFRIEKGARIIGLEIEPATTLQGLNKQVDIRITWDNEKIPAVLCPLSDFFGYAFGKQSMHSWLLGSSENKAYCFFPMPFDHSANIELILRKSEQNEGNPITLKTKVTFADRARNAETEGKLYTQWRYDNPTKKHQPHILLEASGKGHLVGTVLQARGLKAGMTYFFEGDDSTAVDGQFRMHGTGSEDYFNGGWYALSDRWDAAMSLPFSGALDYSLPFARTGGYRLFLSDKISFEKNIYHSIEHGPTDNIPAEYTSMSYYYSNGPATSLLAPTNAATKVFQPDTLILFPQLMPFGTEGDLSVTTAWAYPTGGMTYTFRVSESANLRIPLNVPPGTYQLFLDDVAGPSGGSVSVWQRQTRLTGWIDRHTTLKKREEKSLLCLVRVDGLVNTITLHFKTMPGRDQFILNRLILVKDKD